MYMYGVSYRSGIYMYMCRVSYRERDLHVHVQSFIQGEGFTCTCVEFHTGRVIYIVYMYMYRVSYRERDLHVHVRSFIWGEGFTLCTCTCTGFHTVRGIYMYMYMSGFNTERGIYMYMYRVTHRERDLHVYVQGFIQGEGFTCTCAGFIQGEGFTCT